MWRAILLFLGWSPIAATGGVISLLDKYHLAPRALIEAWWSVGEQLPSLAAVG
jgi:hypothetical protein